MESSIAAFLLRWSACELLPTTIQRVSCHRSINFVPRYGPPQKHKFCRHCKSVPELSQSAPSTVLAQDHFYSDYLGLPLTY